VCGFNRISNDHARGVYRKKTPGGAGTHMGGTSLTRHQEEHVHTDEPHNHPSKPTTHNPLPVKRHRRSRDTHGTHTGHAGAQRHTDHTDEPHKSQPSKPTNNTQVPARRTSARRPKPWPTQQPQARSRPLPAADSEEAAPSEPDPASTRSQSASPRLLSKVVGEMKARAADA